MGLQPVSAKFGKNLVRVGSLKYRVSHYKNAMKRYKRAKLGPDAYNYIHTNMALCYVSTGKTKDKVVAKRLVNLLTKTIFKEKNRINIVSR